MIVLDTRGYDVILGMTWLSRYHTVNDCQNKNLIFRMSHQPEFQLIIEHKFVGKKNQYDCATTKIKKKGTPVWNDRMYSKKYQDFRLTEL